MLIAPMFSKATMVSWIAPSASEQYGRFSVICHLCQRLILYQLRDLPVAKGWLNSHEPRATIPDRTRNRWLTHESGGAIRDRRARANLPAALQKLELIFARVDEAVAQKAAP